MITTTKTKKEILTLIEKHYKTTLSDLRECENIDKDWKITREYRKAFLTIAILKNEIIRK